MKLVSIVYRKSRYFTQKICDWYILLILTFCLLFYVFIIVLYTSLKNYIHKNQHYVYLYSLWSRIRFEWKVLKLPLLSFLRILAILTQTPKRWLSKQIRRKTRRWPDYFSWAFCDWLSSWRLIVTSKFK